jgi:hypothetical protein
VEIYTTVIRTEKAGGVSFGATALTDIAKFTGIPEWKLSYEFGKMKRDYYLQKDPYIEVWRTRVQKQSRPQYRDPAYNRNR